MGNLWLKIKIWTKISFAALLLIYVLIFVAKNSNEQVKFWFWIDKNADTSVLLLAFYAFIAGAVVAVLVSTTLKTVKQIREIRGRGRTDRIERDLADMKAKAAMLRPKSAPPAGPATPSAGDGSGEG
jgi:uncharacterized integral membrane protein